MLIGSWTDEMLQYALQESRVPCESFAGCFEEKKLSFASMEPVHEPAESFNLLEECWFFENLLKRRTRMSRCLSDPCPSSNIVHEVLVKNPHSETPNKMGGSANRSGLVRTPSLPPYIGRGEETQGKERNSKMNSQFSSQSSRKSFNFLRRTMGPTSAEKISLQESKSDPGKMKPRDISPRQRLARAPSLPPCIGREEVKESDPRISKLTRQASHNLSDMLPPRRYSKGMTQSYSIPRRRPPRDLEVENLGTEGAKEMRRRYLNQVNTKKTLSDLEFEELQGFKDLGFSFDKERLDPSVVNILPGLQEKKRDEMDEQDQFRRPYLSEAWLVQSHAPLVPSWVASSSPEDMKTQIKFWARNVASNVKQEC